MEKREKKIGHKIMDIRNRMFNMDDHSTAQTVIILRPALSSAHSYSILCCGKGVSNLTLKSH